MPGELCSTVSFKKKFKCWHATSPFFFAIIKAKQGIKQILKDKKSIWQLAYMHNQNFITVPGASQDGLCVSMSLLDVPAFAWLGNNIRCPYLLVVLFALFRT